MNRSRMLQSLLSVQKDIVTEGLIAYYKFDGNVFDSVGTNDGTINGSLSFVTGISGQALDFGGSGNYVRVPTFNNPPSSQMTLSAWVKTSSAANQHIIQQGRNTSNVNGQYVYQIDSLGRQRFWDYNLSFGYSASAGSSNTTFTDGQWHHIAFVKNGVNGTYYFDGQPDGTKTASQDNSYVENDFVIGYDIRDSSFQFNGLIDEPRVYNRPLSDAEIQQLYNQQI